MSDILPSGGGREHQESSENNFALDFFTRPDAHLPMADLIVHEYAHSWNGRFRQPADLWSPTMNQPVRGSLLWVYEGQTEFWGRMLAAQLGLRTRQQTMDALAVDAANAVARAGRQWKSLADTTNDPLYMPGRRMQWRDWQRREDYYGEALKQAIKSAAATKQPISLGFEADGQSQTVLIPYYGSLRYPRLERLPGTPDRLERLLAPSPAVL